MFAADLLKGRRILVTGGGTGLGKGMSEAFLKLGAEVHICSRRKAVCDATAAELMQKHRSEEHTSELQSLAYLVCRLLLEKKKHKQDVSQVLPLPCARPRRHRILTDRDRVVRPDRFLSDLVDAAPSVPARARCSGPLSRGP